MRATKLTAGAAAVIVGVTTATLVSPSAGAAPSDSSDVVVKTDQSQRELEIIRQGPARELEIIRSSPRLRTMTFRTHNARELEIIRGMSSNDELEIIRIKRR